MKELLIWAQAYARISMNHVVPVLVIGLLLYGIFWVLMKKGVTKRHKKTYQSWICGILLSLEMAFVFVMTLYGRTVEPGRGVSFRPLGSYIEAFQPGNVELLLQVIMNILMFVPLGVLLPLNFKYFCKNRCVILTALAVSVGIESIQGILRIGMFEVDDILGNMFGMEIGFLCYAVAVWLRKRRKW